MPNSVNGINPFPALVSLTLHPVPIKIRKKPIDVVRASRIAIPLSSVITQKRLVLEGVRLLDKIALISHKAQSKTMFPDISKALEMRDEVSDEIVIQIRAHQVRARCKQNTRSTHAR
jgi:hypothetical protein